MIKNKILFISLYLMSQSAFCQTVLKGKIISDSANLDGIHVANISNKQITTTENNGFFSITAKPSDTLLFYGIQVQEIQRVLKSSEFSEDLFFVHLKSKINQLDEVVIKNYSEINAFSLGIIPAGTKSYTPAERKLKTAGDFKPIHLLGLLGGSLPVDPILNKISGRTNMLKKEVEVETKERFISKLSDMYEEAFYTETLRIPSEYIKGFQIFILDNERIVAALKAKNKTLTTFLLGELAEKYNSIIFPEKN